MTRARAWLLAVLPLSWFALAAPARAEPEGCPDVALPPLSLPHARAATRGGGELLVVAIGSSSTEGWRASDAAHTYPAILQERLEASLPRTHVAVVNRGVGGQDAAEELARLDADVIALRPALAIWQVGANGALRRTDPGTFAALIRRGVERLVAAGIDVVLMDNQRAPLILHSPDHQPLEQALADVASATGASLFARGALMDLWQQLGHPYEQFLARDGLHHNDLGYRCVADALARTITQALRPTDDAPLADRGHAGLIPSASR